MGIRDPRLWLAGALVWGFAEATFFFIVPDILLTAAVIMFGLAHAFRLSVAAAMAATAGGLLMMLWGASDSNAARQFLMSVPLIGEDLLFRVHGELEGFWPVDMTLGAISGAPFKIYSVEAGAAGIQPVAFALAGFAARLARFSLAIGLTAFGAAIAVRVGLKRFVPYGLALIWAAIYAFYVGMRLTA